MFPSHDRYGILTVTVGLTPPGVAMFTPAPVKLIPETVGSTWTPPSSISMVYQLKHLFYY